MITPEEYAVLRRYEDILLPYSEGRQVTVTRSMWCDVYPILTKYVQFSGTLGCGYCCTQMCRYALKLYEEFQSAKPSKKSKKK